MTKKHTVIGNAGENEPGSSAGATGITDPKLRRNSLGPVPAFIVDDNEKKSSGLRLRYGSKTAQSYPELAGTVWDRSI